MRQSPEEIKAYQKAYYVAHREERAVYQKAYRAAHLKECKAYEKAYYVAHREQDSDYKVLQRYGLSKAVFNNLLDKQKGVCAICGKPGWNGKRPQVDHDHITGKVRGLLCNGCNAALGHIKDYPKIARAMIKYLSRKVNEGER
jgi:hypothetical protein